MPTYAYECQACGHRFEKFQSMSANALRRCPACEKSKLQRLIGPGAGIIFKGSGFYETDYRSESYRSAAKKDTEATTAADKKADQKTDKKAGGGSSGGGSSGGGSSDGGSSDGGSSGPRSGGNAAGSGTGAADGSKKASD